MGSVLRVSQGLPPTPAIKELMKLKGQAIYSIFQ